MSFTSMTMRASDWLTYDELAVLVVTVCEQLGFNTPRVLPLTDREGCYLDGRTDARTFFQFPKSGAPAHAALHEIAHWLARTEEAAHGPEWLVWFETLCQRLNAS